MSDRKRVIAAYQDKNGSRVVVLDDGAHMHWNLRDQVWVRMLPPLPPEALGEVAGGEFQVGDDVTWMRQGGYEVGTIQRINASGNVLLSWYDNESNMRCEWQATPKLTKVSR